MREIKVNENTIGVNASALALLFYKQEFKSDFIKEFTKFSMGLDADNTNYDGLQLLQFVWAMNKAFNQPEKTEGFEAWLGSIEFDFSDKVAVEGVIAEIVGGYFRSNAPKPKAKKAPAKK